MIKTYDELTPEQQMAWRLGYAEAKAQLVKDRKPLFFQGGFSGAYYLDDLEDHDGRFWLLEEKS